MANMSEMTFYVGGTILKGSAFLHAVCGHFMLTT